MSYNISHIHLKRCDAWMRPADLIALYEELTSDGLPEDCFLYDMLGHARAGATLSPDRIALKQINWKGDNSGYTWKEAFLKKVAPKIMGHVEAVIIWEGGDSISGIRIVDGVVTKCDVHYVLVPKGG